MPDFALESALGTAAHGAKGGIVIGLDESGRGPWAGPVLAAAVWLDAARCPRLLARRLDDCKLLAPGLRQELYRATLDCVARGHAAVGLGAAEVEEIDEINVLAASLRAMARAAAELERACGRRVAAALIDGNKAPALPYPARPVVGGDGLSLSIAAASVVAKVVRDRHMEDLAERHPGYGWERNRGYGTPGHRAALARLGPSPQHRRSFAPIRALIVC